MRTGRLKTEWVPSDEKRMQLQSFARSRSLPAALSGRARLILDSADGESNSAIAQRLKLTKQTVGKREATGLAGAQSSPEPPSASRLPRQHAQLPDLRQGRWSIRCRHTETTTHFAFQLMSNAPGMPVPTQCAASPGMGLNTQLVVW